MKSIYLRITAALLALSMIAVCFTSCKNKDDVDKDAPTKPSSIDAPNEEDRLANLDDYTFDDSLDPTDDFTLGENGDFPTLSVPDDVNFEDPTVEGSGGGGVTMPDREERLQILKAFGYEYDAEQKVFYSTINPWQRHMGFGPGYDELAQYANMRYTTIKIDFMYQGVPWRIQCWKGQYGVLAGGEMGVYTKKNNDPNSEFYECASDEDLLEMSFKYYKTTPEFNKRTPTFERKLQEHWWLTGFQFGYCDPRTCVMEMTLNAKDSKMADGIEFGLKTVKDKQGNLDAFVQYKPGIKGTDFYIRNGNTFKIIWIFAGYINYDANGNIIDDPLN